MTVRFGDYTVVPVIEGTAAPGFGQVRDAFEIVAVREPGLEAQLAVYKDGRQVVDLDRAVW
ncbi:hypothetical protein KV097_14860 [Mumia sp. zg.B17]|uniref:hypothetical protein n=1 Tax=Mumia sp. zg.B17 TaxID=2855446 RepID=UPI001C6E8E38|nr:hypothetical protein [Mumia sp. zg.B17]MBW9207225.1 hypothetical protein [Mumia sp. zg.B17]